MIPSGGNQFSERSFSINKPERDDDSKKSHPALQRGLMSAAHCMETLCLHAALFGNGRSIPESLDAGWCDAAVVSADCSSAPVRGGRYPHHPRISHAQMGVSA